MLRAVHDDDIACVPVVKINWALVKTGQAGAGIILLIYRFRYDFVNSVLEQLTKYSNLLAIDN